MLIDFDAIYTYYLALAKTLLGCPVQFVTIPMVLLLLLGKSDKGIRGKTNTFIY